MRTEPNNTAEVADHAARILEHTPTRCMSAAALHQRVCAETGLDVPWHTFLALLDEARGRFTRLDGVLADAEQACWSPRERAAYAAVLQHGALGAATIIMLATPVGMDHGENGLPPALEAICARSADRTRGRAAAEPPAAPDLLDEVHGALSNLLRECDGSLREAVGAAAAELTAMRRLLTSRRRTS